MGPVACKCSPRRPFASFHRWVALEVKKYLDKALDEKQGLRGTLLDLIACLIRGSEVRLQFVTVRWFVIGL